MRKGGGTQGKIPLIQRAPVEHQDAWQFAHYIYTIGRHYLVARLSSF